MALPKGVHRVRRKLSSGRSRFHFYAWRGGPKFWLDDTPNPRDPDFNVAYADAIKRPQSKAIMVPKMVDMFLGSAARAKASRSFADQRKWLLRFAEHFQDAPAILCNSPVKFYD